MVTEIAKEIQYLQSGKIFCFFSYFKISTVFTGPSLLFTSHGLWTGDFCEDWWLL